jgi:hypothetical protein
MAIKDCVIRFGLPPWEGRLDLAQAACDEQETVWVLRHSSQPFCENVPISGTGMHQIQQFLPFHYADIFHTGNRVVTQLKSLSLYPSKPTFKPREIQRNLLACIDQKNRPWCLELRTTTFGKDRNDGRCYRICIHLP